MDIQEGMCFPVGHNHIGCLLYNIVDFGGLRIVYKNNWSRKYNFGPRHNDIDHRLGSTENDDELSSLGKCNSAVYICNFRECNCIAFQRVSLVKTLVSPL